MSGAGLFERLALAQVSDDLTPHDERVGDIERVTALGFAPALGSLMIRLKGGNDYKSYSDALNLLAWRLEKMARRKNWGDINRMRRCADEALRHFLIGSICKTCENRGRLAHSYAGQQEEDAGEICPSCGGTRMAPRNTLGRATAIHRPGENPARLEEVLDAADGILERSARIATGISRWKLYGRD